MAGQGDRMKYFSVFLIIFLQIFFSVYANTWNDVSRLNPETVSNIIRVSDESDVVNTLKHLPAGKRVVISGTRHSQGGHIVYPNATVLNMTGFNKIISLSSKNKTIVVQTGVTWAQVQKAANPLGLAVKVMQSSNIFSIGGSLSANVHGRDPRFGPVIETVRSIKVVLASGDLVTASRILNPDLFYAAIGGYGLLGVIVEAELELTDNIPLLKTTRRVTVEEYANTLSHSIGDLSLHYGRCSFVPNDSFLKECYSIDLKAKDSNRVVSNLAPEQNIKRNALIFAASRNSDLGKMVRWELQKALIDKPGERISIDRNPAMQPAIKFLEYDSPNDTDILQEYFVSVENFSDFLEDLQRELRHYDVNVLSVTLRYLKANQESYLSYATDNMIAVVLYINLKMDQKSLETAKKWTRKLVDLSLKYEGKYYLTYQRFPTLEQFQLAYPKWGKFMEVKCKYDPGEVFTSRFYVDYLKAAHSKTLQVDHGTQSVCGLS